MATRGHFAGDAAGAREYLAHLAAAGDWTPAKALDDYKDAQITRKASSFYAQMQAGEAPSNKAARGHGRTGEHGYTVNQVGQTIVVSFSGDRGEARARRIINDAADTGGRVVVHLQDKRTGEWKSFFSKGRESGGKGSRGYSAQAVADALETGSLSDFMADASNSPGLDELLANIGGWQIEVL